MNLQQDHYRFNLPKRPLPSHVLRPRWGWGGGGEGARELCWRRGRAGRPRWEARVWVGRLPCLLAARPPPLSAGGPSTRRRRCRRPRFKRERVREGRRGWEARGATVPLPPVPPPPLNPPHGTMLRPRPRARDRPSWGHLEKFRTRPTPRAWYPPALPLRLATAGGSGLGDPWSSAPCD